MSRVEASIVSRALDSRALASSALGLLAIASGCGARTALENDDAAVRDAGPRGACVIESTEVALPFGIDRAEGVLVAARRGGFDLVSFLVDMGPTYDVRRITIESGRVVLGTRAALGVDARSVGVLASRGDRLVLCYGGEDLEGPTRWVRTDTLDYERITQRLLGDGAGDHCTSLVARADRWLVSWQDRRPSSFGWSLAEVDDDGGVMTPLSTGASRAAFDVAHHAGTFVWLEIGEADSRDLNVIAREGDTAPRRSTLRPSDTLGLSFATVAPSRDARGRFEIATVDAGNAVSFAFVDDDLTMRARASLPGVQSFSEVALFELEERRLAAVTDCRDVDGPGRIVLYELTDGRVAQVMEWARPGCPTRLAAASDDTALLGWNETSSAHTMGLVCRGR